MLLNCPMIVRTIFALMAVFGFSVLATAQTGAEGAPDWAEQMDNLSEEEWQSTMQNRLPNILIECDNGVYEACIGAALAYEHGWGTAPDIVQQGTLLGAACKLKLGSACVGAADVLRKAQRGSAGATVLMLYEQGCKGDDGRGCAETAQLLHSGIGSLSEGVDRNRLAAAFMAQSCSLEFGEGCAKFGAMLEAGIGVDSNPTTAQDFYRKACSLGNENGCSFVR